jgi:hypothetical protein
VVRYDRSPPSSASTSPAPTSYRSGSSSTPTNSAPGTNPAPHIPDPSRPSRSIRGRCCSGRDIAVVFLPAAKRSHASRQKVSTRDHLPATKGRIRLRLACPWCICDCSPRKKVPRSGGTRRVGSAGRVLRRACGRQAPTGGWGSKTACDTVPGAAPKVRLSAGSSLRGSCSSASRLRCIPQAPGAVVWREPESMNAAILLGLKTHINLWIPSFEAVIVMKAMGWPSR